MFLAPAQHIVGARLAATGAVDGDGAGSCGNGKIQRLGKSLALGQAPGQRSAEGVAGTGYVNHINRIAGCADQCFAIVCLGAVCRQRADHPADVVVPYPAADAG